MTDREQRGLEIAARYRIQRENGIWRVPSQNGHGRYVVRYAGAMSNCTCPDHELRGGKCKHIFAVEFVIEREKNLDGSTTITQTVSMTETVKRTYTQDWSAYNEAQTHEKDNFQALLHDLAKGVIESDPQRLGRPRVPLADAIFGATFKVYSTLSGRRFMSDLRQAHQRGYLSRLPHYNSLFNYLENPKLTPILRELIVESSLPLKSVEVDFAVDSSGFTTSRFVPWFQHKYGETSMCHTWVKCHLMCGVKTNIVTAVEIHDRNASDTKLLPPMVNATAQNFTINEVSADKGYGSLNNVNAVAAVGGTPYIAFKSIHTGKGGGLWGQMYHYFMYRRQDFLAHYHKRSNVESTFSMMKRKFGDSLRSRTDVAMVNETLCKVLCHNLVVLLHEMRELGIEPTFWANNAPAQERRG